MDLDETGDIEPTNPSEPPSAMEVTVVCCPRKQLLLLEVPLMTSLGQMPPRRSLFLFRTHHDHCPLPLDPRVSQTSAPSLGTGHAVTQEDVDSASWQERLWQHPHLSPPGRQTGSSVPSLGTEETNAAIRALKEGGVGIPVGSPLHPAAGAGARKRTVGCRKRAGADSRGRCPFTGQISWPLALAAQNAFPSLPVCGAPKVVALLSLHLASFGILSVQSVSESKP